jgi:TonB family protein
MNRLQKKCVIAIVGTHLLLLTILIVGPAFFNRQPKTDNTQILDMIPANLIDAAFNSGVKNATPPAPQPVQPQPQPQQQQIAPPPKPVEPTPSMLSRLEKIFKQEPVKPATQTQTPEHKIQPNLKQVTRTNVKPIPNPALKSSVNNLRNKLSKPTEVNLPGNSSAAYANYGDAVTSIYHQKWVVLAPMGMEKDNAVVTFKVKIASDGTVISADIVTPSGDANVDKAVQKMLDGVTLIAPFPEGTTDKERTYTIDFNATKISE